MLRNRHTSYEIVRHALLAIILLTAGLTNPAMAATLEVSTFAGLLDAINTAESGDTILLEDGQYDITGTWAIAVRTGNLTIRGKSGDRTSVVIAGWGMVADGHHGFWVAANHVTIADLTIQNVRNHCIQTDVDTDYLTVRNCILRDAGEQILKVPSAADADYSEGGLVENCLFEYTAGVGPRSYMGGIDVHRGKNWIVRDTLFRDIRSPGDSVSEHAIHFWNDSRGTLVERNRIINCDRGIGFGLGASTHSGGIIRNNMIGHDGSALPDGSTGFNDVGIGLESAADAQVYNNTIYFEHSYNAIEYRFAATTGTHIANNLVNRPIQQRDGAEATLETNITDARSEWFVDPPEGDLHLADRISAVVDQGTAVSGLSDDFDNEARPQGQGVDIGADETAVCTVDADMDTDVDGTDLAALANSFSLDCLPEFSSRFGQP